MATFRSALEPICKALDIDLIYAGRQEANLILDNQKHYPVLIVIPYTVGDTISTSGLAKSKIPFTAMLVTRIEQATADMPQKELEELAVEPMRVLGRQLMKRVSKASIIDKEEGMITEVINYAPLYFHMDAHLHGVLITTTIPVIEDQAPC